MRLSRWWKLCFCEAWINHKTFQLKDYGEKSARRKIRTAKNPFFEKSYGENSQGENSYGENSGHESVSYNGASVWYGTALKERHRKKGQLAIKHLLSNGPYRTPKNSPLTHSTKKKTYPTQLKDGERCRQVSRYGFGGADKALPAAKQKSKQSRTGPPWHNVT